MKTAQPLIPLVILLVLIPLSPYALPIVAICNGMTDVGPQGIFASMAASFFSSVLSTICFFMWFFKDTPLMYVFICWIHIPLVFLLGIVVLIVGSFF